MSVITCILIFARVEAGGSESEMHNHLLLHIMVKRNLRNFSLTISNNNKKDHTHIQHVNGDLQKRRKSVIHFNYRNRKKNIQDALIENSRTGRAKTALDCLRTGSQDVGPSCI